MPLITVILFFIFLGLLFSLMSVLKNRKQLSLATNYGEKEFQIDLPAGAKITKASAINNLPAFSSCSAAESFFHLVTPYIGSMSSDKRGQLYEAINALKNDLKMNKEIYRIFTDEYSLYEGLNEEQAAAKWSGQGKES